MATKGAVYCSFINCSSNTKTSSDPRTKSRLKFHSYPNPEKEKERCLKWIVNSMREDLSLKNVKRKRVCSLHFEPLDYNCPESIEDSRLLPGNGMSVEVQELKKRIATLEQKELVVTDSIFCARLDPQKEFKDGKAVKITDCAAAYASSSGPFDQATGSIKPKVDGAYYVAWKIHQRNEGKMNYFMSIKGMQGRILLGCTRYAGEACSGSMVMPLMTQHHVWLEANRVSGDDTGIYPCNLMGYLVEINNFSTLKDLHRTLFSPIAKEDCSIL